MKTQILSAGSPGAIDLALEVLRAGGLVALPTDTVYGLGALAFDEKAVKSIYEAKDRPVEKSIPVLLSAAAELPTIALAVPPMVQRLSARFWPGPLTLVVPKKPTLPEAVSATDSVGVRVPDNAISRALLRFAGPMAVTSANISGATSPSIADEVFAQLNGRIELILDGGKTQGGLASTVVDCTKVEPTILRLGPISLSEIKSALARRDYDNDRKL